MSAYKASFYNIRVSHQNATLLFNGRTGALFRLDGELAARLGHLLGPERDRAAGTGYQDWEPPQFAEGELRDQIPDAWETLVDATVFNKADEDERDILHQDYRDGTETSPFYVTVTSTLDCNMRCYYCYQKEGALDTMSPETGDAIAEWLMHRIEDKGFKRLYLDWYGGEPMLNRELILRLSRRIIPFCDERGVLFKASMICNGTNWPEDIDRFLNETRLFRVQFSLDGPAEFHNKRRGLLKSQEAGRAPSYDEVMKTIAATFGKIIVYLRINVDPKIGWHALDMIDILHEKGWLDGDAKFYPYVAAINDMTEHCHFIEGSAGFKEFEETFNEIQKEFYNRLSGQRKTVALEKAMYYPTRKIINCAAINRNATVFGPNGLTYKCGLDVGDEDRADGGIGPGRDLFAAQPASRDPRRWDSYDPFTLPRCRECQYLPLCLGGCPKGHMEGNAAKIRENSAFFERHFDTMIREYYESSRS